MPPLKRYLLENVGSGWNFSWVMLVILGGLACTSPRDYVLHTGAGGDAESGPWNRVPGVALAPDDVAAHLPAGILNFEILKVISEQFFRLEGATNCDTTDPVNRKPIRNLSAEYCSALYVVNTAQDGHPSTYELRLTTPRRNRFHPEWGVHSTSIREGHGSSNTEGHLDWTDS